MREMEMKKNGMVDESYIKNVMSQMANTEPEDFDELVVDIPTNADDGEEVAILCTGKAMGGKLTNVKATEFDIMGQKPGLKNMLSAKEDGEHEEEENNV